MDQQREREREREKGHTGTQCNAFILARTRTHERSEIALRWKHRNGNEKSPSGFEREREREREMECVCAKPSMTRFGAILPLRQYFLKPHSILSVYLVFGTILNLLWQIVYVIRPIFTVANGQILNIWSHWCKAECERTLNYLMAESGDGKVKEWFVGDFLQQTKTLD